MSNGKAIISISPVAYLSSENFATKSNDEVYFSSFINHSSIIIDMIETSLLVSYGEGDGTISDMVGSAISSAMLLAGTRISKM